MATLLEQYKGRLKVAERMYAQQHNGEKLSESKKLTTAKLLQNTSRFINEAFTPAMATQTGLAVSTPAPNDTLGQFKKFAMNLVNVVMPNLIANDIAIVYPMSSMSGYLNYIEYSTGNKKGDIEEDSLIANPFAIGDVKNFTGQVVTQTVAEGETSIPVMWTPLVKGAFQTIVVDGKEVQFDPMVRYTAEQLATKAVKDAKIVDKDKNITFANVTDGDPATIAAAAGSTVAYKYDNVVIPQKELPMLKAEMKSIALLAHARRIAVYYSQIAAFQAKTDYGFDLGDQLAEKAAGQLAYEIDTEVVETIDNAAGVAKIKWSRAVPQYLSKAEHYEGFSEAIEIGKQLIYDATKRFAPNYMLIASDILPILTFIKGFQAAPAGVINGPYFAGTLNGVKVFVTPAMEAGRFVLGVNGDDMMSSAVVYAPYMPIVPTQLLGFADGGMTQGWSTLYDMKVLNKGLVVAGQVVNNDLNADTAVLLVNPTVQLSPAPVVSA